MSSSFLSGAGGGRAYCFDFDFAKSPSPSSSSWSRTTSLSSSSESTNSQLAIATRKPRTPRKRPNQTYNEAAALLSAAFPNLFSTPTNRNFIKPSQRAAHEPSQEDLLLFPFRGLDTPSSFLIHGPIQMHNPPPPPEKLCLSPGEISSRVSSIELVEDDCGGGDFDAESIIGEEIEEGAIDRIMGGRVQEDSDGGRYHHPRIGFGGKFDFRLGFQRALRRQVDDGDWRKFRPVDILQISPKLIGGSGGAKPLPEKKKKKKAGLMLKLNYDGVRSAWSGRGSPFADDIPASGSPGNDTTQLVGVLKNASSQSSGKKSRALKESRQSKLQE